ncbi:MAG: hypothetical protein FIO02_01390 [Nitrosopumilales archaeon]|nr:hypothetical protein [Nitrosopumilales archaeon]MRN60623.1 hypothetical protein [Nitrosopumilales archaeon]MRN69220.1 hypothetical protein [Nitrosopumilales archaeon]
MLYSNYLVLEDPLRYRINQITDSGINVSLTLSEDLELETVSQQQLMLESIDRVITDKEVKDQVRPILEAILSSQPQTLVKTYAETIVQITMPRRRYEKIGSPRVGEQLLIDIRKP